MGENALTLGDDGLRTRVGVSDSTGSAMPKQAEDVLLKAGALQRAIFNSANFSSIATDATGVIQIFNVGAERMLGFTAAEVTDRITPAEDSEFGGGKARIIYTDYQARLKQLNPGVDLSALHPGQRLRLAR